MEVWPSQVGEIDELIGGGIIVGTYTNSGTKLIEFNSAAHKLVIAA